MAYSNIEKEENSEKPKEIFVCQNCRFSVPYDYFGRRPPFSKSFVLMEEAFVMKDPFSADGGMITLGSNCSSCGAIVCLSQDCSLFYTKRFCLPCVKRNLRDFPSEIIEASKCWESFGICHIYKAVR
ncbi:cysteine-rich DPF motif domain-containing protein 1-like isoform X1 [Ostrea edulis]|uniref:cysteine-rich DPF motif domain-containing protein 1-like isoform X1 n=1 Tax=Ostrea edulis TaxID=37623 RepID=UPI0024AE8E27|nr:cysteine-rich DPF motif domain-containing protein 1-like isoform X1 [Ostrea edulis]